MSVSIRKNSMNADPDRIADVRHRVQDGVLVVELVGRASVRLLMSHVIEHLDAWTGHDRLIYDFRGWDVSALTADSLLGVTGGFKPVHDVRSRARAALLIRPHLEELARILIAVYESEGQQVELCYFFEEPEAFAWLKQA
ncbi:MAG: hypothetical protein AB7I04_17485 [Pseudomonadales bacterium]